VYLALAVKNKNPGIAPISALLQILILLVPVWFSAALL
jgi:hypothetical protein